MKILYKLVNTLSLYFLFITLSFSQVTYVNTAASGGNNGSSWADAYTNLTAALENTTSGEIWIAAGTYNPMDVALDTFNTFNVTHELAIYGGFDGTEANKEDRVLGENTTVLSGDLMGNDIDNNFTTNKEDNVFHIMTVSVPSSGTVILDGLTFKGGHTRPASENSDYSWRGGAIYSFNTLDITNCNFNNNFARSAGSIYLNSSADGSSDGSTIDNCVFEQNSCVTQGAGVYASEVDNVTVSNTTFMSNTTNRGALYPIYCENFLVDNCTFANNISTTPDNFGGAMFIWNSTGTVRDCIFESNNSGNGAAIHLNGSEMEESVAENFTFDNCTFTGNFAAGFGGGAIRASSASYTIKNCDFNNNYAANGGGIFSNGDYQQIITSNNTFTGNTADFGASQICYGLYSDYSVSHSTYTTNEAATSGGGMINGFGANVTIDSCDFMLNIARFGGAISNQNDTTNVTILNSNFIENTVNNGNGGAVNMSGPITLTVDNSLFESNTANFGGAINGAEGAIDVIEGYLNISNSIIIRNNARIQGAGISLIDLDLQMSSSVIGTNFNTGEEAEGGLGTGGGISANATANKTATFNIINSTFADNFAAIGAGISAYEEDATANCQINLQNTIMANAGVNYEIEDGEPTVTSTGGNISSDGSLEAVFTNTRDKNNISNLNFINTSAYDFNIENDSPAINNGVAAGAPETDILGNPRVGGPDAGAFEHQDPLSIEVIENSGQLTMMPNPAMNNSTLSLSNDWIGSIVISILDGNGKLIRKSIQIKTGKDLNYEMDLDGLNSGFYIVSLQSKDQKISTSLIKL